jgi:GIY-YIG catalytic domain protein
MKSYLIYKAENKINGKCYIGRTSSTLSRRRSWHYSNAYKVDDTGAYKNNSSILVALRNARKEDFEWIVLESGLTKQESFEREAYYINLFHACECGYNEKESDLIPWNKGKKMNAQYCERLKGENNGMFGKTHSPEYRVWRSELMSRTQFGANNSSARKVKCLETGQIWNSVVDCSKETGISSDNISACCNPKRRNKTAGGYHFIYIDGKTPKHNVDFSGGKNPRARRVICVETKKEWNSLSECARELEVSQSAIGKACRLKKSTVKGLHFEYL